MSEPILEELMLSSAQEYFHDMTVDIEKSVNVSNPLVQVVNQIEMLKDIYSQAQLHLECYKSHDRLLRYDLVNLSNKKAVCLEEFSKIRDTVKISETKVSVNSIESLIKEKHFIEDQIIRYKMNIEQIRSFKETCMDQLKDACTKVRIKDGEINNLQAELKRRIDGNRGPSKYLSGLLGDKLGFKKSEFFSKPMNAASGKSSTMESSKSSLRFF